VNRWARSQQLRRYVENRHIDHIPAAAAARQALAPVRVLVRRQRQRLQRRLGAVVVSIGLTFWWALIAIAAGTLIGRC
jgi:hypothetical protein